VSVVGRSGFVVGRSGAGASRSVDVPVGRWKAGVGSRSVVSRSVVGRSVESGCR
jgi:hypothetical protein